MVQTRSQARSDGPSSSATQIKDTAAINGHDPAPPPSSIGENDVDGKDERNINEKPTETSIRSVILLLILIGITIVTVPPPLEPEERPSIQHVWYYGWITAVSTGLGVIPLVFVPDLDKFWIGVSNAIAAGMMIAASYSLFLEGCTFDDVSDTSTISPHLRTSIGAILGLAFILTTKNFLDEYEDLKVGSLAGADAKKVLLIIFVMTLHSFSEGIGIGVSFGGEHGTRLGAFISASLAVHNIPEGLAVAIVLLPRKMSKVSTSLWCIVTSLPQPIMAVPAYMFVNLFIPILPVGLGFAGGAMMWVACFELIREAWEDTDVITTGTISTISLGVMLWLHELIDEGTRG